MKQQDEQPPGDAEATAPAVPAAEAPLPRSAAASAIVLRADQDEFDARQVAALALISPGLQSAPRAQLAVFFHYCVRSGLDPFARQIYMIGRKNRGEDREDNPVNWTIQTGIDGFRTIAHRAAERTGERISYEETVYYDAEGTAHEVWLAPSFPAAVKVTVLRGTSRFPFIARWGEFAPTYWDAKTSQYVVAKMWRTMPAHMLRKCAEAGSLRMAAPQDLSGMYVEEEMAQADAEVVAGAAEDAAQRLRAAAGLDNDGEDNGSETPEGQGPQGEEKPAPQRAAKSSKPKPEAEADGPPAARERSTPRKRASSAKPRAAS
ncbi:phage recombination protein Bet [Streptomyces sp. 769]|uniref:phage recombination protein Bet n=1 Tax=Streptomyces sp. 769 TaxID=1262452 RepID=UPI000581B8F3|nr:phage recombination protein Bet [Streptomyces sp. 769]AJC58608.1 phage protein [Streptomyces sp. 769]